MLRAFLAHLPESIISSAVGGVYGWSYSELVQFQVCESGMAHGLGPSLRLLGQLRDRYMRSS